MASVITDRFAQIVDGGPGGGGGGAGIHGSQNVTGTNDITANADPTIRGYAPIMLFLLRPVAPNTGAVFADWDSSGRLQILKPNGDPLAAGEFSPNLEYLIKFNITDFRIIAPSF